MNESTALFLASLSHRWFFFLLLPSLLFAVGWWRLGALSGDAHSGAPNRRFAAAARSLCGALLVASVAVLGIAFLHLGCSALIAKRSNCETRMKRLTAALMMYAEDNDQRLPLANRWADAIAPRVLTAEGEPVGTGGDPFRCPSASGPYGYGMNAALSGSSWTDLPFPPEAVLLFEADAPFRSYSGDSSAVAWSRHQGTPNIGYADGHVRYVTPSVRSSLRWSKSGALVQGSR